MVGVTAVGGEFFPLMAGRGAILDVAARWFSRLMKDESPSTGMVFRFKLGSKVDDLKRKLTVLRFSIVVFVVLRKTRI